jgi:hypothetical protein
LLGLDVELYLDQANYMLQKLSKNAGAKIVIHDPTLPPLPDEYGIDMQPNSASTISIQMVIQCQNSLTSKIIITLLLTNLCFVNF